jgi:hypothetical protein
MKGEMEKASQQAEQGLVRRLQAQGTTLAAGRDWTEHRRASS